MANIQEIMQQMLFKKEIPDIQYTFTKQNIQITTTYLEF